MAGIELYVRGQNSITLNKEGFGYLAIQKISDTLNKTGLSWAQFQKGQPTPWKTTYAFPCS